MIPIGSTEQHGPHLPLDTDTQIAVAVASGAAERVSGAVVAPPIAIAASGEHAGFAGTLSIGLEVVSQILAEIVRTAGPEFESITVVSGHGGNVAAMNEARSRLLSEGRSLEIWWPRHADGDAHAGRTETSVMLAIAPDAVHLDRATAGVTTPMTELFAALQKGGVAEVSPSGVLGDPTGASSSEGSAILKGWVDEVTELLQR